MNWTNWTEESSGICWEKISQGTRIEKIARNSGGERTRSSSRQLAATEKAHLTVSMVCDLIEPFGASRFFENSQRFDDGKILKVAKQFHNNSTVNILKLKPCKLPI